MHAHALSVGMAISVPNVLWTMLVHSVPSNARTAASTVNATPGETELAFVCAIFHSKGQRAHNAKRGTSHLNVST
jgi:hypothetical protein